MFFHTSISSKRTTVVTSTTRKMENIKKCDKQKNVIFLCVFVACLVWHVCVCGNVPFNELYFSSMSKWKKFTSFKEYLKIHTNAHSSADFIITSSLEFHSIFLLYYSEERKFFIFLFLLSMGNGKKRCTK